MDRQMRCTGESSVIDCVTLWSTNFFFDNDSNVDKSLQEIKSEFDRFVEQEATFIFVTNEIGMGGIAVDPSSVALRIYKDG